MSSAGPDEFAEKVLRALGKRWPEREFLYEPERDEISEVGNEKGMCHFLSNMRAEYQRADSEGQERILGTVVNLAARFADGPPEEKTFLSVAERLLPRAIDLPYLVQTQLLGRLRSEDGDESRIDLATSPHAPSHVMGLVVDDPESMRYVSTDDLEQWETSIEEASGFALRNLEIISEQPLHPVFPGLYESPWKDNHDASRLFLESVVKAPPVTGRRVVALPNRDSLFVTGSDDEEALRFLAERIEELAEEPRFAGGELYVEDDAGGWEVWSPDSPPELKSHFDLIGVQTELMFQHGQQELLSAVLEKEGVDVCVAGFQVMQDSQTGEFFRFASWAQGVPTYLPRTDAYGIEAVDSLGADASPKRGKRLLERFRKQRPETTPPKFVPAEVVFEVCGDLIRPVEDSFPPLWETLGDPSDLQLVQLAAAAFEK